MKLLKLVMRAVFLILGSENYKQESEVTFHLVCLVHVTSVSCYASKFLSL